MHHGSCSFSLVLFVRLVHCSLVLLFFVGLVHFLWSCSLSLVLFIGHVPIMHTLPEYIAGVAWSRHVAWSLDRGTERQTDAQADGRTDGRTDRQAGRHAGRQTDRQVGRQTDTQSHRHKITQLVSLPGDLYIYCGLSTLLQVCLWYTLIDTDPTIYILYTTCCTLQDYLNEQLRTYTPILVYIQRGMYRLGSKQSSQQKGTTPLNIIFTRSSRSTLGL